MKTVLAIVAFSLCLAGCGKKEEMPEFKACVQCRENVKFMAAVCKHCRADPDGPDGPAKRAAWSKIEEEMPEAVKLEKLRDNFDVQIEELKKRQKDAADETNRKVHKLEAEKTDLVTNRSALMAELESMKAQYDQLAGNAGSKDAAFANLQQENNTLNAEKQSWITERQNLQTKATEATIAQTKLAAAEARIQALTAELDKNKNPTAPVKPPVVKSEPTVGKIANVDLRFGSIILNRGSADGLKIGDKFNVFRNNKFIGRIEVTRLSATNTGLSIAKRSEGKDVPVGAQFQLNDDLVKLK